MAKKLGVFLCLTVYFPCSLLVMSNCAKTLSCNTAQVDISHNAVTDCNVQQLCQANIHTNCGDGYTNQTSFHLLENNQLNASKGRISLKLTVTVHLNCCKPIITTEAIVVLTPLQRTVIYFSAQYVWTTVHHYDTTWWRWWYLVVTEQLNFLIGNRRQVVISIGLVYMCTANIGRWRPSRLRASVGALTNHLLIQVLNHLAHL